MANLTKAYTASDGQEITLTPGYVAQLVLGGNVGDVPESEYAKVIMTCAARGLNPLAGDVAVQPRWDKNRRCNILSVVPTKDYFQRRAAAHPSYAGKEDGVIVLSHDGRLVRREGCGVYAELGEKLLGGWCRVHVKGREVPEYKEVSLAEYDQHMALWKSKPATMIVKVAKSHALREAFPNEFQGLYEPEEMGLAVDEAGEVSEPPIDAVVIEGEETVRVPVPEYTVEDRDADPVWQRYEREFGPVHAPDAQWEEF